MGQVTVTLNARTYRLRCGDGEEARLAELASYVSQRVDVLSTQFGQHGDERLLLMAALLITEEMLELKHREDSRLASPQAEPDRTPETRPVSRIPDAQGPPKLPEATTDATGPADGATAVRVRPDNEPARRPATPGRTSLEARLLQARGERP